MLESIYLLLHKILLTLFGKSYFAVTLNLWQTQANNLSKKEKRRGKKAENQKLKSKKFVF